MKEKEQLVLPNVSSFAKLTRVIAYVYRFIGYCKKSAVTNKIPISVNELERSTKKIMQIAQNEAYEPEISALKAKKEISASSVLKNLSVFLDNDDILRVGGRLTNAKINYDAKHQMLVPKNSNLAEIVIREAHEKCCHGGPKLTEAILRQKFWIIGSTSTIKKQLRKCVDCKKQNPRTLYQQMADLPAARVTETKKPFEKCMVDFTGAVMVKTSTLRASKVVKAYIAIFVCMAVKAIHIELVSDSSAKKIHCKTW